MEGAATENNTEAIKEMRPQFQVKNVHLELPCCPMVKTSPSNAAGAEGVGSIPHQDARIPYAL